MGEMIYNKIVLAARSEVFYGIGKTPDTVDGRFEILVLHVFLATQALRKLDATNRMDQQVFDAMVLDLDSAIRELGVGDTGVGKKVKAMAKAFYGRANRYLSAMETGEQSSLRDALAHNLGEISPEPLSDLYLENLAKWCFASESELAKQKLDEWEASGPQFALFTVEPC